MITVFYAQRKYLLLIKFGINKMGYLSVGLFIKEQIIALTKAGHNKRDVEQLLSRF